MLFFRHFNIFSVVTADTRRKRMLEDTCSDLIDHEKNLEYYSAMVKMLKARKVRLEREVAKSGKLSG